MDSCLKRKRYLLAALSHPREDGFFGIATGTKDSSELTSGDDVKP